MSRNYISLQEARHLAPHRDGRPVSYQSIYRWALKGVDGRRLKTVRFAGRRLTTPEWVADFTESFEGAPAESNSSEKRNDDSMSSRVARMERAAREQGI